MLTRKTLLVLNVLLVISMLLAACQQTAATPQVVEKEKIVTQEVEKEVIKTVEVQTTVEVEKEKIVEVTPTPAPTTRQGAWVDQLVFIGQDSAEAAVAQLQAGDLDLYAYTVDDPNVYETVQNDENLGYANVYGSSNEITFNPAEFTDGRMNPFSNKKIREAINMLIDRQYLIDEISGGLGVPKFSILNAAFPDYARYAATMAELEAKYAFNPDKAKEIITAEMEGMGATLGSDGKFQVNGEPLYPMIFLIRTEDERREYGDYVANQLETVGFTIDRQYKTRSEASPLWVQSDPHEGLWNLYTGGWISTAISRDDGLNFSYYYTPRDQPIPLNQSYTPDPEFDEITLKLRNNDFTSMEERDQLFDQALRMSLEDSVRVWLVDSTSFSPFRKGLESGYDLAGGHAGAELFALTTRWAGQEGGLVKIAQPGILVEPWNPIAGSNWIYDSMPQRATMDWGVTYDPYTGLTWPRRIESAEVTVAEGTPMQASLDWVTLSTAPSIEVPEDAWADWDAVNQKFITAGEKYTETQTAKMKVTVTYPADLYETVKWHDGSPISVGDFVMFMIMTFDPGKEESGLYDAAQAELLAALLSHFRGVKIVSTDPLVIESYSDQIQLDAEVAVRSWTWYPVNANAGGAIYAWHNVVPGILAEQNGELAFSTDKATEKNVEWTSFIAGPSLEVQKTYLDQIVADNTLPFSATLSEYISADEISSRYANLASWYERKGHLWLGTGPFYVDQVFPVEGTLTLRRFPDYPDMADRWLRFGAPMIAEVEVDGPGNVTIGQEAVFNATVTYQGEPYPADQIASVKYLVFDATGAVAASGDATAGDPGAYTITLPADVTGQLQAGSNRLQVVVVSNAVAIPTFATFEFVTAP